MITAETINYAGAPSPVTGAQRSEAIAILSGRTTSGIAPLPVSQSAQEADQFLASAAPHLGQAVNQIA